MCNSAAWANSLATALPQTHPTTHPTPPPCVPWLQLAKSRGIRTINVVRRQELADELKALG